MPAAVLRLAVVPLVLALTAAVAAAEDPAPVEETPEDTTEGDTPEEATPVVDEGELPAGKFGLFTGARWNGGDLADLYGWGLVVGIDAHYYLARLGQKLSFGLGWSTAFGRFAAEDSMTVDDPLRTVEMSGGLRVRYALGEAPRFLVITGGGTIFRTSVPVPPGNDRIYLGGHAGLGYEQFVLGRHLLSAELRYELIGDGPRSVTLTTGLGFAEGSSKLLALISMMVGIGGLVALQNL